MTNAPAPTDDGHGAPTDPRHPPAYFYGRRWDAPMADDAVARDLRGLTCGACQELVADGDDAMVLGSCFHVECLLRSTLGDVAHAEGRCSCFGGTGHDDEGTYRDQSRRLLDWMLTHHRGRWAPTAAPSGPNGDARG